jgi:hypothetical protein
MPDGTKDDDARLALVDGHEDPQESGQAAITV